MVNQRFCMRNFVGLHDFLITDPAGIKVSQSFLTPYLSRIAIDLDYVFWNINKLVNQSLAIDFGKDAALIVVAKCTAHCLVVHVRLIFVHAPQLWNSLRVDKLEDAFITIRPLDETWTVFTILKELQQEFPQVCCRTFATLSLHSHFKLRLFGLLQFVETMMLTHADACAGRLRLKTIF